MNDAERAKAIQELSANINSPHFYRCVAKYDPDNRRSWTGMATTQQVFKDGEGSYDKGTRQYSENMRKTLHVGVILVFKDKRMLENLQGHSWNPDTLYTWFIKAHITAFVENGWLASPSRLDVVNNVRGKNIISGDIPMMINGSDSIPFIGHIPNLSPLDFLGNVRAAYRHPDPYMKQAARLVKQRQAIKY